jgi:hypothetical protein
MLWYPIHQTCADYCSLLLIYVSFLFITVCRLGDRIAQNILMVAPPHFLIFGNLDISGPHFKILNKKFWEELVFATVGIPPFNSSWRQGPRAHDQIFFGGGQLKPLRS